MKDRDYKTKRELLFELFDDTFTQCKNIIMAKNHDYADQGDPYSNFRSSIGYGVHPITGIMLRVNDKLQRIKTFVEKGRLSVLEESFEDSCNDIINYMILAKGYYNDELNSRIK